MKPTSLIFILAFAISSCVEVNSSEESYSSAPPIYISPEEYSDMNLPFSQAVIVGDILYVSGHVGEINQKLVEGGIGPETRQAMENIKKVIEANGSSMDDVIKCTCMLADISEWGAMNEVYKTYFPNNKPARSALGASGLALNARVEIECMAYVSKK